MRLRVRHNIRLSSLVLLGGLSLMLAGCATSGPKWARETPEGFRYDYVVGTGEAATLSEALVAADPFDILDSRKSFTELEKAPGDLT